MSRPWLLNSSQSFKRRFKGVTPKSRYVNDSPPFLGCFCHAPCCDFTQHPQDSFDMVIPRASTHSAADSGSSTPSTHTENENAAHTQTNGNSVGRGPPGGPPTPLLLRCTRFLLSLAHLQMLSLFSRRCACRPLGSCCIHSNLFYRLTMNHFFVWAFFFFLTLGSSFSRALVSLYLVCSLWWLGPSALCRFSPAEKGFDLTWLVSFWPYNDTFYFSVGECIF